MFEVGLAKRPLFILQCQCANICEWNNGQLVNCSWHYFALFSLSNCTHGSRS